MKEFFKNLIPGKHEANESSIDERYPVGARKKREQNERRYKPRWRGKISLPYDGSRLHEHIRRAASTDNPHVRRLSLNKIQKEINRQRSLH